MITKFKKYFYINNYKNKLKDLYAEFWLALKKPLKFKENISGEGIIFSVLSIKEYYLRYKNSFIAEKTTLNWIENISGDNLIFWDIGANVGAYSLLIGKKIKKLGSGHVYSFEPESGNYQSLNRNIRVNKLENFISALPLAVSSETKIGCLFLSSIEVGSATHALNEARSEGIHFNAQSHQSVLVYSGDELCLTFALEKPNYLKIDVDGHELEVIKGMSDILASRELRSILIEVSEKVSKGDIERLIGDYGFIVENSEEWGHSPNRIFNYVFVKKAAI